MLAFIFHLLKQPLLLAYIAAGVIIGPNMGFQWISNKEDIAVIAEIGLILLLFMIGLEIDMKKLRESGKALVLTGILQFILCAVLGYFFFSWTGLGDRGGKYDLFYLAVCSALSSTAIVIKLLYGKYELATLAGGITLGVLVFQDIWAIVVLGIQPNLANPSVFQIALSFAKGGALVAASLLASRFILPRLFKSVAKFPELVLVASLGWCFLVCGAANYLGLSIEMGALIAGVSISTFPYNLDVIAKVISIRDFFVTLFFVALGMQIPNPLQNPTLVLIALVAALFLITTRFLSVYPVLFALRQGHRQSLLPAINLANMSEFSLVIASLGLAAGHIANEAFSIIIFTFVITAVAAPYLIKYNQPLASGLARILKRVGIRDVELPQDEDEDQDDKEIVFLGFFRVASSLIREIQNSSGAESQTRALLNKIMVVDFNPNSHEKLQALGVKAVYGDISHLETLHHAGVHGAKVVISTIPDTMLVGTDNLKMIRHIQKISPHAKIIVTAETSERAMKMYAEGADYVLLSRHLAASKLSEVIQEVLRGESRKAEEVEILGAQEHEEIVR